jgi:hypothetical protein
MTRNLRERIVADNEKILVGPFGLPGIVVDPTTGIKQSVRGQVIYHSVRINPDTGARLVSEKVCFVVHTANLTRVPALQESWVFAVPATPSETAPLEWYATAIDQPPENGRTFGFVRLYGTRTKDPE